MSFDPVTLVIVCLAFLLGGTVKGVTGLGILIVTLAVLTMALDLLSAMALLLVPGILTNVWQAVVGGHLASLLQRLWPFLLAGMLAVLAASTALTRVELSWLTALLGLVLVIYAGLSLGGIRFRIEPKRESWLGLLFGVLSGTVTGMTGSTIVPGTLYLQALELPRDMMVQAMGLLYLLLAVALALAMQLQGLLTLELGLYSLVGVVPAIIGMILGQRIRRRLSETLFRQVLLVALLATGVYILATSI